MFLVWNIYLKKTTNNDDILKKIYMCFFVIILITIMPLLINYCINKYNLWSDSSSSNPDDLAKLYDENLQLAKCLREKGINVSDPTQQEPKIDLSELDKSKEEISPLLKECGYGELGYEK